MRKCDVVKKQLTLEISKFKWYKHLNFLCSTSPYRIFIQHLPGQNNTPGGHFKPTGPSLDSPDELPFIKYNHNHFL